MLLIETYIQESSIPNAGLGCFTKYEIKKGTKIWELNPFFDRIYTEDNLKNMTDLEIEFVKIYSFKHNGLYYLCIDNARFFNHSKENCNTLDPLNEYCTYALVDIPADTEILSDYSTFGSEADIDFNTSL